MATLKIESSAEGKLRVSLARFGDADLAALKAIPGHKWDPGRKHWSLPDTPETRKALAAIVAAPPAPPSPMIAAKPKESNASPSQSRGRYVPGRDKPLTTNPPHPLIKQVDDELVLRGMALRWHAQIVRATSAKLLRLA